MSPFDRRWTSADAVQLACILEAAACKAGNVHPGQRFEQTHFGHFAASAIAIRPCFEAPAPSVGSLLLATVEATLASVGCNTNLGMLLLFAPLAVAMQHAPPLPTTHQLRESLQTILNELSDQDAVATYEAIRRANPGGLGQQPRADVQAPTDASTDQPLSLREAMKQVASFDAVARQYTHDFADIFERLLPWLDQQLDITQTPTLAIERLHVLWLAHEPDGLIVRKSGKVVAEQAQRLAEQVARSMPTAKQSLVSSPAMVALDSYLRADGNRRNPGTTADLIAATLFVRLLVGPDAATA